MYAVTKNFLKNKEKHRFHLVATSQLPFITSTSAMLLVMSFVFYFHQIDIFFTRISDNSSFHLVWAAFSGVLFSWFFMVIKESGQGHHTWAVRNGLRFGMVLFIISEIMFFFAFFWAFFHVSLAPSISVGSVWPPKSLQSLDVWGLPLINTTLLLTSGVAITFAHHALLKYVNKTYAAIFTKQLLVTVIFGTAFLFCQWIEYKYGIIFHWKESVYGTTFFVTTGFHGLHVTIGTIFLLFCLIRAYIAELRLTSSAQESWVLFLVDKFKAFIKLESMKARLGKEIEHYFGNIDFRKNQHLGFEAAAWYWHFVDVVWIFLFITVYWWGSV